MAKPTVTPEPTDAESSWKAAATNNGESHRRRVGEVPLDQALEAAAASYGEPPGLLDKLGVTGSSPVPPIKPP